MPQWLLLQLKKWVYQSWLRIIEFPAEYGQTLVNFSFSDLATPIRRCTPTLSSSMKSILIRRKKFCLLLKLPDMRAFRAACLFTSIALAAAISSLFCRSLCEKNKDNYVAAGKKALDLPGGLCCSHFGHGYILRLCDTWLVHRNTWVRAVSCIDSASQISYHVSVTLRSGNAKNWKTRLPDQYCWGVVGIWSRY